MICTLSINLLSASATAPCPLKGFAGQKLTRLKEFLLLFGFIFSFALLLLWDKYDKDSKLIDNKIMAKAAGKENAQNRLLCEFTHWQL